MKLIHVDANTMSDSRLSPNFDSVMNSFETLMAEGYMVQVVIEIQGQPVQKFFQTNDYGEFSKWVHKGCPTST